MVCLTLTLPSVGDWHATFQRYADFCDCIELRVDLLARIDVDAVLELAATVERPTILTLRRSRDGGGSSDSAEADRLALLSELVSKGSFTYVDLEEDLRGDPRAGAIESAAAEAGTLIIRSLHDFTGTPTEPVRVLDRLAETPGEIPKLACTPAGTRDVHALLGAYSAARNRYKNGFILLGMGRFGFPTRILAPALGALLTFTSATGAEAAPGHIDPQTMEEVYNASVIGAQTRVFGIIGNPVLHSQSPHYHNPRFRRDGIDAVYVPFPTDDVEEFFRAIDSLGILGFSVTIPHKEAALAHLIAARAQIDSGSRAAGACNTVARLEGGFVGVNTDVPGFLEPLQDLYGQGGLSGKRATIIGAGGAARAICYALASHGVSLLILNRTAARAERLAADIRGIVSDARIAVAPLSTAGFETVDEYRDIIVQTTGIGMAPDVDADPVPTLPFQGTEVVYDIIYTPEQTVFLKRAAAAGCRTITGRAMFDGQAREQYRLFRRAAREAYQVDCDGSV